MVPSRFVRNLVRAGFSALLAALLLLSGTTSLQAQESPGYALSASGLVSDRAEHWQQWTRPRHATLIDGANHSIAPLRIRKQTNAIEDMGRFQTLIGDDKAYEKLLRDLDREGHPLPLNIRTAPASVAGVPIVHLKDNSSKGIKAGDPITWFYFHGGIREAPTNPQISAHILDGDPSTYWEPSSEVSASDYQALTEAQKGPIYYFVSDASGREQRVDQEQYDQAPSSRRRIQYTSRSLANWYIDVDLGRVVPVSRIALRFVDAELGDPFRQFRILGTPSHSRDASLVLIARTTTPNVDERQVEFDLTRGEPDQFVQLHRLRLAITDSKLDKFKEISREEYLSLPVDTQGDIDYYIVNAVGSETKVDKSIYNQVGPERQGRLVYFQRERPRLASIEVWTQGDNIALGVIDGGGNVDLTGSFAANPGFDGLFETNFLQLVWSPDPRFDNRGVLTLDLGAVFWLDQLRMVAGISGADEIVTRASDGSRDSNGSLRWQEIDRARGTGGHIEKTLENPIQTRFLTTQIFSDFAGRAGGYNTGDRINEFQIFGQGYPAEVVLTSPLIELPGAVVLGTIEWQADIPDSNLVEVEVRTRTGDQLVEVTEYYGSGGEPKTQSDYDKLPTTFKGPVVTRMVPGGDWSPWSQRYLEPGDAVTSPSPRRYLQIQVKLRSRSPELAGALRSVHVSFISPLAQQILAEIWPLQAPLGTPQDFELFLNPTFVTRRPGGQPSSRFDQILIDGSPIQNLELLDVGLGSEQAFAQGTEQTFSRPALHRDASSGEESYWFADAQGRRFQALIDPASGDTLKILEGHLAAASEPSGEAPRLLLHLPRKLDLLTASQTSRIYHRIILQEGEEVPVDENGRLLNELTFLNLPRSLQGNILYFKISGTNADGTPSLLEVNDFDYRSLPDSLKGGIRYFRKLIGKGGEFPFDRSGTPLTETAYNALPAAERGAITGAGEMVRVRFEASVLLNGTTIDAAIRDSQFPAAWQQVDAGNATNLRSGSTLSIAVPFSPRILQDVRVEPNPFTPNEDGLNDRTQIHFSIGNLNANREIRVQIFDLGGRRVWEQMRMDFGTQVFVWDGRDMAGERVPPGLYLCRIGVDVDAEGATHMKNHRLIAVAY